MTGRRIVLLALTSFTFYTSAQLQISKDQDWSPALDSGAGGNTGSARGLLPPRAGETVLIQPVTRNDKTVDSLELIRFPPSAFILNRRLRVEMKDGTFQEFELPKVKRVAVEPIGSLPLLR